MSAASDPAHSAEAVVFDADISKLARALWVGSAGNVSVVMSDGTSATFTGVQAGTLLPIRVKKVNTSGTTATGLLVLI